MKFCSEANKKPISAGFGPMNLGSRYIKANEAATQLSYNIKINMFTMSLHFILPIVHIASCFSNCLSLSFPFSIFQSFPSHITYVKLTMNLQLRTPKVEIAFSQILQLTGRWQRGRIILLKHTRSSSLIQRRYFSIKKLPSCLLQSRWIYSKSSNISKMEIRKSKYKIYFACRPILTYAKRSRMTKNVCMREKTLKTMIGPLKN